MGQFVGKYHNRLDKKYFHKSIYIKKWEETFNVKIKDYPLQYELVFESFNTLIKLNNILFSTNYLPKETKVDKILDLLNGYLNTYKNKINKSFDSECILIYESFEEIVHELTEMKQLHKEKETKYNLTSFENDIAEIMYVLENLRFDCLQDSKDFFYSKVPNDKLPKLVNCKIINELEKHKMVWFDFDKQKKLNDEFIKNYFDRTGIDLTQDEKQRHLIFEIHIYIKDINNALVNLMIYKDIKKLELHIKMANYFMEQDFTCLEDVYYKNLIKRIDKILLLICDAKIRKAYNEIQAIIKENNNLYERVS